MSINKKELIQKVEGLVDQLEQLVGEYNLTEVKEYVEYYDLVAKMIVASGQTPIEKIAHASSLIGILSLKLQGKEKVDQMLNSGMKMVVGDGKIEISYAEKPGVTNIAKENVIDFNAYNGVADIFPEVVYDNEVVYTFSRTENYYAGCKQLGQEPDIEVYGFKSFTSGISSHLDNQNPLTNPETFHEKVIGRYLDKHNSEGEFDAIVTRIVEVDKDTKRKAAGVSILRDYVSDTDFYYVEIRRENACRYRGRGDVIILRKLRFREARIEGYNYLIEVVGLNLNPVDLIKFIRG